MSRKPRIWYPGAMYHITCRGNRKTDIFHDREDRDTYLTLLEKTRERYPFYLLSYCLMTNHIHLQSKTIYTKSNVIMQYLNSLYASYINKKYDYAGHVFQGRYGAELTDSMKYLLDVSRYIHLNPVEAGMISSPEQYQWSSCRAYTTNEKNPHVQTSHILSFFPNPQKQNYKLFIEREGEDNSINCL
ncbi:transposase [Scopulibacillus cellulosilyticus]|uniref:Transposase n=1 Tax=Scopulibacillus cellulosilyticus TaxID=2665665 RepID=A0ABW2PWN4_9BACL